MNLTLTSCTSAPDFAPLNDLLIEYYDLMRERIVQMGAPLPAGGDAIADFWENIADFLPPNGRLFLAHDENGALVGCGSLKALGDGKGELKRLYVKPHLRGSGLGRQLVELRLQAAKEMGLRELLVDTMKANVEMQGLYGKLGFEKIPQYSESGSASLLPELQPYLVYFRYRL
ncbi:MAG: GNAT family N-acetyltransferase [Paracoccaceae bacterium]